MNLKNFFISGFLGMAFISPSQASTDQLNINPSVKDNIVHVNWCSRHPYRCRAGAPVIIDPGYGYHPYSRGWAKHCRHHPYDPKCARFCHFNRCFK